MRYLVLILCAALFSPAVLAMGDGNPVLTMVNVEELDWQEGGILNWDAEAWVGRDINKLWFKTEGEYLSEETERFEAQALYNRSITPFWNLQTGWRGDFQPDSHRSWAALGIAGLMPGFVRTELTGFLASGRASARLKFRYHAFLSQTWMLIPRIEANWYSEADPANSIGDGLADLELDLRLAWRPRPDLMPYVGVSYTHLYGRTADFAAADGDSDTELRALIGLSFWF